MCSGDQLELICTTTGRFLELSFSLIPEGDATARRYVRVVNPNSPTSELEVNSITFTFSIISAGSSLHLTSRLLISPVRDSLNGTQVNCTDVGTANLTSTIVTVINNNSYYGEPPPPPPPNPMLQQYALVPGMQLSCKSHSRRAVMVFHLIECLPLMNRPDFTV